MKLAKVEPDLGSRIDEMNESQSSPTEVSHRSDARRTHRACDRCRVKKSKCNGQQPCNTCSLNERTCVFSALRRRDIRKWHCHMQDTIDEAIQRLYRACRDSGSFPGDLPVEKDGLASTEAILHGMGFSNLDLKPKAASTQIAESLRQTSSRVRIANTAAKRISENDSAVKSADVGGYKDNSDTVSMRSTTSNGSPSFPAEFSFPPSVHNSLPPQSPVIPLEIRDQFYGTTVNHPSPGLNQQFHQQQPGLQQYHQHQMPGQMQFNHSDHPIPVATNYPQFAPVIEYVPQIPMDPRMQQHLLHQQIYDTGSFINPHQVWPGYEAVEIVSQ